MPSQLRPLAQFLYRRVALRALCVAGDLQERLSSRQFTPAIPPPSFRYRVHGDTSRAGFLEIGENCFKDIRRALQQCGKELSQFKNILDFGCGCARVLRWLAPACPEAKIFGTDIDAVNIAWCKKHLPRFDFRTNEAKPPLAYSDNQFDLVYAISVFTHLDQSYQQLWLAELHRVLKPGGLALCTVLGESCWGDLNEKDLAVAKERGLVFQRTTIWRGIFPDWYQTTYQSKSYVEQNWQKNFKILSYLPQGMNQHQDLVVLEKAE